MTILIDQPLWSFRGERWSHLVSDHDYGELHLFAQQLGVRRVGFQGDHYDIPERLLALAVDLGASQVDTRVLVRRLRTAGLRKPRSYSGWTLVARNDVGTSTVDAISHLYEVLADHNSQEVDELCQSIAQTLESYRIDAIERLAILDSPTSFGVAIDVPAATDIDQTPPIDPRREVWVTRAATAVAIDVLQPKSN